MILDDFFSGDNKRVSISFFFVGRKKNLKEGTFFQRRTSFNQLRDFEKDSSLSHSLASLPIIAPTAGSAQTL